MYNSKMKRHLLDMASTIIVIAYLELAHIHFLIPNDPTYRLLGSALIMMFIVPLISVAVRIVDIIHEKVRKTPVGIKLSRNRVTVCCGAVDQLVIHGDFSTGEVVVADPERLKELIKELFVSLLSCKKITLAPYVVVIGGVNLSKIERDAATRSILRAGASYVAMANENIDLASFAEENHQPNLV